MGDRGSIQVRKRRPPYWQKDGFKPTLFRHWGGGLGPMLRLAQRTRDKAMGADSGSGPYARGEAPSILAALVAGAVDTDGYSAYIGTDEGDGDNSDNGHYILWTREGFDWDLETPDGTIINVEGGAIE